MHSTRATAAIAFALVMTGCAGKHAGPDDDAGAPGDGSMAVDAPADAAIAADHEPDATTTVDERDVSSAFVDVAQEATDASSERATIDEAEDAARAMDASVDTALGEPISDHAVPDRGVLDAGAHPIKRSDDAPDSPLITSVVINEIHAAPSFEGVQATFVELYNTGATAVDISGWWFDNANPFSGERYRAVPPGTRLEPHAFLTANVLILGVNSTLGTHLLDAEGREVSALFWERVAGEPPVTWGRCPDGRGSPIKLSSATPGAPNDCPD